VHDGAAQRHRPRVLIAGGGVAALETVLALDALVGRTIELTLLTPSREFLYRPVTVAEAFDAGEARSYRLEELLAQAGGGRLHQGALARVLADEHVAVTGRGERIPYEKLVVAAGAVPTEPIPGAFTFRGREDVAALREVVDELVEGDASSIAFALPSERAWPLPLYELALLTAAELREHGRDAPIRIVTPEEEPLALFGPETGAALRPLLEARGIELHCLSLPAHVDGRSLVLAGGARIPADRVVTLPMLEGPRLPGLPHDARGFIPTDDHGRVTGVADVFAAGDVTAFPLKQGGLAAQQADAAAQALAAELGAAVTPAPFTPVLRGLLLTGGAPLYLRCEPQRLKRSASVAIDFASGGDPAAGASAAAGQPLWWPPAKVAGRYLAPFLATARPDPLGSELLTDRIPVAGAPDPPDQSDALELALLLAECDARWGDYASALSALDAAYALSGALPAAYEAKRRAWVAARRLGDD
jgi:sulfide:quinone oxidoreductase